MASQNKNTPLTNGIWNAFETMAGNPGQVNPYSNPSKPVKPAHTLAAPETPFDPSMLPSAVTIGTSYDREGVLESAEIPEVVPIFLGLQKVIAEWRVGRSQAKLEEAAERHEVIRHVGESILRGKGYAGVDDPLRPVTKRQRFIANRLERITHKRRGKQMRANNIAETYPHIDPSTPDQRPVRIHRKEHRNLKGNETTFGRLTDSNHKLDRTFQRIVRKPGREAAQHARKRNAAIAKSEAIDRAIEAKRR